MMSERKGIVYMPVRDFIDLGYLQEVNRRLLHPAGLAMALHAPSDELTNQTVLQIWDCRSDPEGMLFAPGEISPLKVHSVDQEIMRHFKPRINVMGTVIQYHDSVLRPLED